MASKREKWLPVILDGALTANDVSNMGRVRNRLTNHIKGQHLDKYDHLVIGIYSRVRQKRRYIQVAKLVAVAFLGPCPPGKQIEHKDQNDQNNMASNLEYLTQSENITRSYIMGKQGERLKRGWENTNRYLSQGSYDIVRQLWATGCYSQVEIGKVLGITNGTVSRIIHGITEPRYNAHLLLIPDWSRIPGGKRHE